MRVVRCAFLALLLGGLAVPMFGCGAVRVGTGLEEYTDPADGVVKVRVKAGPSPVDTAAGLLGALGPWGIAASTGLLLAQRIIRHREVLAHGQKDDDFDGVPDDQQRPTTPPAPPAPTA